MTGIDSINMGRENIMTEQEKNEKEYLLRTSNCILSKENPFVVLWEKDKELFMIGSPYSTISEKLDRMTQYRTLYDIVIDLSLKIEYSLKNAIENAYSDEALKEFDILHVRTGREWSAYYYIENALFRIESLWDILAQIFNVKYSLESDIKKIYHDHVFSKEKKWEKRYWSSGMPDEIEKIVEYLEEEDNTDIDNGEWKGNYHFVKLLRNDMTHKLSISESTVSNYSFCLRKPPAYIIKRASECFASLQNIIYSACGSIVKTEALL